MKCVIGCGSCYSVDGNWKLTFPHCMFPVCAGIPGLPTLNFPDVCTEQLMPKSAFCIQHTKVAEARGYPTSIREFLKHCGIHTLGGGSDEAHIDVNDVHSIDENQLTSTMVKMMDSSLPATSSAVLVSQGWFCGPCLQF